MTGHAVIPPEIFGQHGDPAVVVFSGEAQLPWLRVLRPGFRHCFVLLWGHPGWLTVEALSNGVITSLLPQQPPHAVAAAYRERGHRAVIIPCCARGSAPWPPAPFSCVESVKRSVGLRAGLTLTPYGLWKKIIKIGNNS